MRVQAHIYHKRAERYSDCQDYFGIDHQNNRIAVSDGMSQSVYPQWWAEILVKAYLDKGAIPASSEELQVYQDVWQDRVQKEIAKRESEGRNPWRLKDLFAEKSGAGATLCGFTWSDDSWGFECIGDSSLIVINEDYTARILSSQDGAFGNHPDYLDSFQNGRGEVKSFNDSFKSIKALLIVTDPFSDLFQKYQSDKEFIKDRLSDLHAISDHKSYCELVELWRDQYDMHNDDSTVVLISDFSCPEYNPGHIDNLEKLCEEEARVSEETSSHEVVGIEMVSTENYKASSVESTIETSPIVQSPDRQSEDLSREFRQVCKGMLSFYKGKRSKKKIFEYLKKSLEPIISEYLQK